MAVLRKLSLVIGTFLASCIVSTAQVSTEHLTIYFEINSHEYNPDFRGNGQRMNSFIKSINALPAEGEQRKVLLVDMDASASPDGSLKLNQSLAQRRFATLEKYLKSHINYADTLLVTTHTHEDWEGLTEMITKSDVEWKKEALNIINKEKNLETREHKLRFMQGGKPWEYMAKHIFPELRKFTLVFKTDRTVIKAVLPEPVDTIPAQIDTIPVQIDTIPALLDSIPTPKDTIVTPIDTVLVSKDTVAPLPVQDKWVRKMTIKTNLIGIGMGHGNISLEVDLAPHWSIAVPFYYSGGFDYFKPTLKFRGIVLQPELRYYFKENGGLYLGAHFGLGWYNFALDRDWRIQDHEGNTPSWGGGLGLGYALQFKKNPHWGMEFAVGGGVYKSKYDIFYNEENGPYHQQAVQKLWYGVDNASIAFTYKFGLKKGGNK